MNTHDLGGWSHALAAIALSIPLVFAAAALLRSSTHPFRAARAAAGLNLLLALTLAGSWAALSRGADQLLSTSVGSLALTWRLDVSTVSVLTLVSFVAFVIVRYSRSYLRDEVGQARYVRWLMATLTAVVTLVLTNNLLVLALAWVGTSLSLHQLLTFYADRLPAQIAAHKKFLVSRVADVSLFGALALIGAQAGSLELDVIHAWADAQAALPPSVHAAAFLLVLSAALKCAQLPFHGWLIQVMEAPTPVSALLHAGVVNIGGFLMIRMAPVMVKAPLAQTLLVVIGSLTVVLAALVMMTRVSIKVNLAWSTCAQMGFMLVQCGLGAYDLALLHLLAHSLYKAHAFLSSGSVVDTYRAKQLQRAHTSSSAWRPLAAVVVALCGVAALSTAFGASPGAEPALWAFLWVLGLALTPLLARTDLSLRAVLAGGAVASLYLGWHGLFSGLVGRADAGALMSLRLAVVIGAFASVFLLQVVLQTRPHGALARALYPRLFAGFYLDEVFTRLTFRIWPPRRLPRSADAQQAHLVGIQES